MDNIILLNGDCIELLDNIPDGSVDLILTDPPYNISQKGKELKRSTFNSPAIRRSKNIRLDFGDWDLMDRQNFLKFTKTWFIKCINKLREGGACISFFNKEDIGYLIYLGKANDCRYRTIYTWHKTNPTPSVLRVNYLSSTEFIFIGSKGQKQWTFNYSVPQEMHNFFETANSSVYGETIHPTEKPISLMEHFIRIHTNKNDTVLDCFMGSGTTGVAAINTIRKFIGIEKNVEYFNIAKERIDNVLNSRPQYIKVNNMRQNTFEEI